jgi:hypothetical protein
MRAPFCALLLPLLLGAACPRGATSSSSSGGGDYHPDASITFDAGERPDAAHETPDAGPGCGPVSVNGECTGDTLRYCDVATVREVDCAARGRQCLLQPTLGGFWCVGVAGSSCDINQVDVCPEGLPCVLQVCGGMPDAGALDSGTDAGGVSSSGTSSSGQDVSGSSSASGASSVLGSSTSG